MHSRTHTHSLLCSPLIVITNESQWGEALGKLFAAEAFPTVCQLFVRVCMGAVLCVWVFVCILLIIVNYNAHGCRLKRRGHGMPTRCIVTCLPLACKTPRSHSDLSQIGSSDTFTQNFLVRLFCCCHCCCVVVVVVCDVLVAGIIPSLVSS